MQMDSCGSAVVTRPNHVCKNTPPARSDPVPLHAHSLARLGTVARHRGGGTGGCTESGSP